MTDIFIHGIDFVKNLIMLVFPSVVIAPELLFNLNKYFDIFYQWISLSNFIVPLPDIFLMITLVFGTKITRFVIFLINWIIRRIADFFP